jgi:hypothetical protein
MTLWAPGTIEGITPAILTRVCYTAARDHAAPTEIQDYMTAEEFDPSEYCDINPDAMPIRDVFTPEGDSAFDRVSRGKSDGEVFTLHGKEWRVKDCYGRPWRLELVADPSFIGRDFNEREIADALNATRPHPNPYVAVVEVEYSSRGYRAGYGVRVDGSLDLWYN